MEKWASDGGYYTKGYCTKVSKAEADFINQTISRFKHDINNPETVITVDNSIVGQINWKIIQDLEKHWGIKFEIDSEDFGTVAVFWLAPNQNLEDVNQGLENAWQLFYDKIQ